MRVLIVYCHPVAASFTAAVRDTAIEALDGAGHETRLIDLYGEGFNPVMYAEERERYHDAGDNEVPVADHLIHLKWAEALVFVYPTWWYGLPAMLKGWLDRVWIPHVTFTMPEGNDHIKPLMTDIRKIAAISTCGSPRWWMVFIGHPGRRTLLTGIRALCARRCKTLWLAHYLIDSSTPDSRKAFLDRVRQRMSRF